MSDTQRNFFTRRACEVFIAGAFVLLGTLVSCETPRPIPDPSPASETEPEPPRRVPLTTPGVFDAEAYYRTIIDNNLFRPLGWTPPRPKEPYRLLGILLPRDAHTPPKVIIKSTAGNQTHIVTIGESLDASTEVFSIEPKQVTLETDGQRRTLKLTTTHWLNPSQVSLRFASQRHTPVRPPQGVRRTLPRTPSAVKSTAPPSPAPRREPMLSQWQTASGEPIRLGDARLKNPAKWELRRR